MDCLSLALTLTLSPFFPLACARTLSLPILVVNVYPSLSFFRASDSNRGDHVFQPRQLSSLTLTEAPLSLAHEEASSSAQHAGARLRVCYMYVCVCVRARAHLRLRAYTCVIMSLHAYTHMHETHARVYTRNIHISTYSSPECAEPRSRNTCSTFMGRPESGRWSHNCHTLRTAILFR